ncbi:MAG TPA: DMT family transporter, partial [Anaeromyxobacteraceae bacterium]|nr:DMT family transporter [Anaeromyxobacteraceae bacterium]
LPVVLARSNVRALLPRWRPIVAFTVLEMGIPWLLLSDAERRVTSSLAGLFMACVPFVGVVLSRLAGGHEALGARRVAGLGVGLAGVVALLGLDVGGGDALAIAELAVVAFGYAYAPRIVARSLADLPTLDVTAASLALCAIGYAPFALAGLPAAPGADAVAAIAVLGVVCTATAFLLFFRLIAEVGPIRATVITYVNPAVAVVAGVLVLGEPFTLGTGIGFVLILAGSWLATGSPTSPAPVADAAAAAPEGGAGRAASR